jgi:D-glycero-alpha-D-manno-heptose-7-phosphate kinase
MPDRVVARCGCRIDLAGGTLDIWPLGLLHPGACTVNLSIGVPVSVGLRRRSSGYRVRLEGGVYRFESLDEMAADAETALLGITAEAIGLGPAEVVVESASPRGGGLGASSAITVALIAAAERLDGRGARTPLERAELSRDLEARLMGFPTGLQDHLPPQLGGALEIAHRLGGPAVRRLEVDLDLLAAGLTIVYSGRSHLSGRTNWEVVRRRIDGDGRTVELFSHICDVARSMGGALERGDLERVGRLVDLEWESRRRLAEGVSTIEVERILAAAREAGAWGGKPGGAGGGGCVALLHPPEAGDAVRSAAVAAGGSLVAARPLADGLRIEEA